MIISSKDNPKIKSLVKLFLNKTERNKTNLYIVEGYHLVEEAYKKGLVDSVYSIKEEPLYKDAIIITKEILKKITSTITPEGIIATVRKNETNILTDKVLYLDQIQDPGNLGTILRSALSFNFNSIILDNTVDLYNPKVIRSTMGSIFRVPCVIVDDLKANRLKINLIIDQSIHFIQIILTFLVCYVF